MPTAANDAPARLCRHSHLIGTTNKDIAEAYVGAPLVKKASRMKLKELTSKAGLAFPVNQPSTSTSLTVQTVSL